MFRVGIARAPHRPGPLRRALLLLAVPLVPLALVGAKPPQDRGPPPGPTGSFGDDHAWDDRKAEVSQYDAQEIVEGELRVFEAWSVVVAELLDTAQMVKKEQFDLSYTPVLKCNWFLRIPTGMSSYQQMATLMLRRADMLSMKVVYSSQEWCGTTFTEWHRAKPGLHVHSYFDGEADTTYPLEDLSEDVLFYEQVPMWVRSRRPLRAREEKVTLIEKRLASARCPPPKLVPAKIVFRGLLGAPAEPRVEVDLVRGDATDTFVLGETFPFTLREWRRADGTTWKLLKSKRIAYWDFSKNEFADRWEKE